MKLKSIRLNSFKCFSDETIDFGDLTILTGLNSSGKSSVVQSILMMRKAVNTGDFIIEEYGSKRELININPGSSGAFGIEACLEDNTSWRIDSEEGFAGNGTTELNVKFPEIIRICADRFGPQSVIPYLEETDELGCHGENIVKCIDRFRDREIPEFLRHPDAEGITFMYNLRAWLSIITPGVNFKAEELPKTGMSRTEFNGHRSTNVGFGLSYALPVIVALLMASIQGNRLVIIENPEAHLHPKGQAEMARLIGKAVEAGVQVIIETHSDHIFDGVRLYAKESGEKGGFCDLVKTYWFELDKKCFNTKPIPIKIHPNGMTDEWPTDFFDQFETHALGLF